MRQGRSFLQQLRSVSLRERERDRETFSMSSAAIYVSIIVLTFGTSSHATKISVVVDETAKEINQTNDESMLCACVCIRQCQPAAAVTAIETPVLVFTFVVLFLAARHDSPELIWI